MYTCSCITAIQHYIHLIYNVHPTLFYNSVYITTLTQNITIKNNHPTAKQLPMPLKPAIYFLNLKITTLCSSVTIIIVHKYTNIVSPFIIFITITLYNITLQYNIPLLIPIVILVYHNITV